MKKNYALLVLVLILGIAAVAPAITTVPAKPGQPLYADGTVVQNNTATAPMKAAAVSGTTVLTKGGTIATFNMYTSNRWFSKVDWCVTKPDGTPVTVKRHLGNNTAYMPGSCGSFAVNREYSNAKLSTFGNLSTTVANGTYHWTIDRN